MGDVRLPEASLHTNVFRESKENVFKKYKTVQMIGQGSMGVVSKVKIRPEQVGGSAFHPKDKGFLGLGVLKKKPSHRASLPSSEHGQEHLYALKSIMLDRVSPAFVEELKNEINILRSMDHPNIVKAHEVYFYRKHIYLVLELCDGGDLYARGPYSERESAKITAKLLAAVKYMHDHSIVHRDLKFENIMFEDSSPHAE
jgi:serine/threonine protein kinase